MVLPILVPSNDWARAWSVIPDHVTRPKPKRAQRTSQVVHKFVNEQEAAALRLSRRLTQTRNEMYWPRVIAQQANAKQDGQDAVELIKRCELLVTSLLRRWRKMGGVHSTQVQRLARSCDAVGCIQSEPRDELAIAFMLQAMFWGGLSHPWALAHERVHPATGLMRWLAMFSIQTQCDQPRWIAQHLHASMTAYKHRALAVARLLLRTSKHGRLRLCPELLKDKYWGFDVDCQNYYAKRI